MCRLGVWPKLRSDAASHIDTIDGHGFERQIPRFCAIDRGKRSKACLAISAWPFNPASAISAAGSPALIFSASQVGSFRFASRRNS